MASATRRCGACPGGPVATWSSGARATTSGPCSPAWRSGGGASVDGVSGPQTQRVVDEFQHQKHLDNDGIVGPRTWEGGVAGSRDLSRALKQKGGIDPGKD